MNGSSNELYKALEMAYSTDTFKEILRHDLVTYIITVAVALATLVLVISLFMEMYYKVLESRGSYMSVMLRLILVIFLLANYTPFVFGAVNAVDTFTKTFVKQGLAQKRFEDTQGIVAEDQSKAEKELEQIKSGKDLSEAKDEDNSFFGFSWSLDDLSISQLLVQGSIFITQAALFAIFSIRNVSLTLLAVVGPFALITLMSRHLQTYGWGWMKSFANVLIWPILIALILFIQDILLSDLLRQSSAVYKAKLFGYNIVFIFFLIKVMRFLPELAQGKAGAFSTAEGMMSALLYASGLGAAKGAFKGLGKATKAGGGAAMGKANKAINGTGGMAQRVKTNSKYAVGKMIGNELAKNQAEMERINNFQGKEGGFK